MKTTLQKETRPSAEVTAATRQFITPNVDISETKNGYVLKAEMPGVSKSGLEVTLEGQELTIVGHRELDAQTLNSFFVNRSGRISGAPLNWTHRSTAPSSAPS